MNRARLGRQLAGNYFDRFGYMDRQIAGRPHADCGLIVVIPCFNEPDLVGALASLWNCERPDRAVEVIVVINCGVHADELIRRQNDRTFEEASAWAEAHADPRFRVFLLHFAQLPRKHAGVGLARKIGMDEAMRRFADLDRVRDGVIVSYDADCRCAANYLTSIEKHFRAKPGCPGCSIYFEHPLAGPLDESVYEAAAEYELHLRYYVQALRWAGYPLAYHTVGSAMAVRAQIYAEQGGMNRRQAGEDFYFLQKIIPLGGFADLNETAVYPSPRPSDRVPFGTGRAVRDHLGGRSIRTYALKALDDLRRFLCQVHTCPSDELLAVMPDLPEPMRTFLEQEQFTSALSELLDNAAGDRAARKRLFAWLNGFRVMKFMHHARDRYYGEKVVSGEAAALLRLWRGGAQSASSPSVRQLLQIYRQLDREEISLRGLSGE